LFGHFKHESNAANTLINNNVLSFCDAGNNEVIIGTGARLCTFNVITKKFTPFYFDKNDKESPLETSQVFSSLKDADGTFWFGTYGGGLFHYYPDKKKFRNYNTTPNLNSLSSSSPSKLVLDNSNNLWIANITGGINFYDRKTDNFIRFTHTSSIPKKIAMNNISGMIKDRRGIIWISTKGDGLIRLDPVKKEFTSFYNETPASPQGIAISTMYADEKNILWMSTTDGLIKYNPETNETENHTGKSPLFKHLMMAIVGDNLGNLWLQSLTELIRYNPPTGNVTTFYTEEGAQGREFSDGAALKLKDGRLILGGINGFNLFDPKNIVEDKRPPFIAFTGFHVLNKPGNLKYDIAYTNEITLSYRDYFFSVDFAAMDFSNPAQNQFKYKLDGFNDDWVDIGKQHSITFTNLDPGKYTLNIKAANKNARWNDMPLKLAITITPPFWRTTWFYLLCIFTGGFSIYAFIKQREKQLIKDKTTLETKVKERTEELNVEKVKVEEAHKDIKDSIQYAQKIQSAVLPSEEDFKKLLPGSFIFFKPKDIVSGDFYWLTTKGEFVFYAVADCTGHGVPGGFMTMLGNGLLNELVNEHHVIEPGEILNKLREKIITSLKQTGKSGENKDGMDIVLFRINTKTNELCYSAANNGFIIVNNGSVVDYAGDKQPVGIYGDVIKPFRQFNIKLQKGDSVFSFTDGFPDQFGGPRGKKFKYKPLNELLVSISHLDSFYQKEKLESVFNEWRGELEQVDDVCVIGIRV